MSSHSDPETEKHSLSLPQYLPSTRPIPKEEFYRLEALVTPPDNKSSTQWDTYQLVASVAAYSTMCIGYLLLMESSQLLQPLHSVSFYQNIPLQPHKLG